MPGRHLIAVSITLVFSGAAAAQIAASAVRPCPALVPAQGPFGYQNRGDRCEGLVVRRDSSSALILAAVRMSADPPAVSENPLYVTWKAPAKGAVSIHADSMKPTVLYEMDTTVSNEGYWAWPTDVIRGLSLSLKDVGLVGTVRWKVLDSAQDEFDTESAVYVPLLLATDKAAKRPGAYSFVIIAGVDLVQVYTTLARQSETGAGGRLIRDREPLNAGPYPAGKRIVIDIPIKLLPKTGVYTLSIGATLKIDGGVSSTTVHFFHSREP